MWLQESIHRIYASLQGTPWHNRRGKETHRDNNKYFLGLTSRHRRNRKGTYRNTLKRIRKSGLRIYSNYQRIPRILGGMGVVICSTSRGIMTDREA
ncbi:hypothetical protein AMTRI_Chr08g165470 [Amborella trichopoda]